MKQSDHEECKILFLGDSITDGNRYKLKEQEWDLNHQMGHSYAYIINGLLGSAYPEKSFSFINRGISGNRVADMYARVDQDVIALRPNVLSVLAGVNDGPLGEKLGIATDHVEFDKIYRKMLDRIMLHIPDIKLILCEPFVCNTGGLKNTYNEWRACIEKFQHIVMAIATDYKAVFVPLQEVFDKACEIKQGEYWCWDGIHPTENGHGLIAKQWLKVSKELLGTDID